MILFQPFDRHFPLILPRFVRGIGLSLIGAGVSLCLWCIGAFALIGKGTPAPFDPPRKFVAAGPYRYVRNPMYLGALAVVVGVAIVMQSIASLGVGIFFLLLAHLFVLIYEEPALERKFGGSYLDYKRSVRRWLPGKPGTKSIQ